MEITSENFWGSLLEVLEAIAAATYVSIDLEMTGIRTRNFKSSAKDVIDIIYEQAKAAAEHFQIVQFGLTCISHSRSTKAYHARTFNFHITPFFTGFRPVDHTLARILDRYVGLSHNSIMFLRDNDFHMDRAFKDGVPYLSRREMEVLRSKFLQPRHMRSDTTDTADRIVLADYGHEAILFGEHAHSVIDAWHTTLPRERDFVNIGNPYGGRLNALQIRIIQELVKDQYPDCRTFPRNDRDFMQVIPWNRARDTQFDAELLAQRQDAVSQQKGFTFVMEALMGFDFARTLPIEYLIDSRVMDRNAAIVLMTQHVNYLQSKLTKRRPILVGHNCLYDLCFIYHSFIGPLPDTIEVFGGAMHYLFPRLVDTKHLGRRPGNHSMLEDKNLFELFESAELLKMPQIFRDPDMPEVIRGEFQAPGTTAHQAGYDSWMTAVVFLKYAWSLAEKAETEKSRKTLAKKDGRLRGVWLKQITGSIIWVDYNPTSDSKFEHERRMATLQPASDPELMSLIAAFKAPPAPGYGTMHPDTNWIFDERPNPDPNVSLLDSDDNAMPHWKPLVPADAPSKTAYMNKELLRKKLKAERDHADGKIPDWEAEFWRVHGNKIRIGDAGVLNLNERQGWDEDQASG